ncbi:MAG: hypothetical protein KF690_06010 [Bacteroidetes bacterium]|nr:hypothetical protein [Bacteroidota bacterium]
MDSLHPIALRDKTFVPYITQPQIETRVQQLAAALNDYYGTQTVLLMPILTGALRFVAGLLPLLEFPYELHCIQISTYATEMSAQKAPAYTLAPPCPLPGLPVLLLEDIVDTGHTLDFVIQDLLQAGETEVQCASLLFKPAAYKGAHRPRFVGFEIPNAFVVGYGLDYAQQGRHLPHLYQLAP